MSGVSGPTARVFGQGVTKMVFDDGGHRVCCMNKEKKMNAFRMTA